MVLAVRDACLVEYPDKCTSNCLDRQPTNCAADRYMYVDGRHKKLKYYGLSPDDEKRAITGLSQKCLIDNPFSKFGSRHDDDPDN